MRLFFLVLVESGQMYGEQRISRMSAAVAYRGIFALAPLMLIAVWVFGLIIGDSETAQQEILSAIADIGGEQLAEAVETFIESVVTTGSTAAIVGAVLLLWTTSSLFYELQNDLNDIFEVPYEHTAGAVAFVQKRGIGFLWTLGLALLGVFVFFLNLLWGFFEGLFEDRGLGLFHTIVSWVTPFVSLLILPVVFGLVIRTLTRVKINRAATVVGSVFTTVVFLAAAFGVKALLLLGLRHVRSQLAGALFVILLAAYVLSGVFLLGGVVTKTYHDYYETGALKEPPPVVASFLSFFDGRSRE